MKSMDGTDRVQNVSTLTFDRGYNKANIGNGSTSIDCSVGLELDI